MKLCLMKYGIGRWVQILETGLFPGKLIQQLNGQTQRLIGQQSLSGLPLPACCFDTFRCASAKRNTCSLPVLFVCKENL